MKVFVVSVHFIFTSCLMVKNTHSDMFLLCYIVLATGSICVVNMFNMEWPQVAGQRWVPETRQKYGCFSSFRGTFWESLFAYCPQTEACRMGGHPECICVAREERGNKKDDGSGRCGYQAVGWLCGTGGCWKTEGMSICSDILLVFYQKGLIWI